jgi:hypothetical protein
MSVRILDHLQSRITNVGGIAAADLSVGITPGDGAKIIADVPAINTTDWVYAWLKDAAGNREVIRITAVAVDVLTIVRGINARFPARAWAQGDIVHFALSKSLFDDMHQTVADALSALSVAVTAAQDAVTAAQDAVTDAELAATTAAADTLANIANTAIVFTNKSHGDGLTVTGGPLDLGPADADDDDEGAEIVLRGASVHEDVSIDRFQKQTRFFGSSPDNFELQLLNTGAGKFNAMISGTTNTDALQIGGVAVTATPAEINAAADGIGVNIPRRRMLSIGDWNMDADQQKEVAHGLLPSKIRGVSGLILSDLGAMSTIPAMDQSTGTLGVQIAVIGATTIKLYRAAGSQFDGVNYDATSYNRGYLIIDYVD